MIILTETPLWILGFGVALMTLMAMSGPLLVRRFTSLEWLSTNNEVAGFKFAIIGVIYAVLLGFAVITVWDRYSEAEGTVGQEAGAAATIFRLVKGIDGAASSEVRARMTDYLHAAMAADWPAMQLGRSSPEATRALSDVYVALLQFQPKDARESAVMTELLHQLDLLAHARRARLVLAAGIVPNIVWVALFGGAFITIGYTFLFGTKNLGAQAIMTGGLSLTIFSILMVIIAIDHPFAGTVRVDASPLEMVLADLGGSAGP